MTRLVHVFSFLTGYVGAAAYEAPDHATYLRLCLMAWALAVLVFMALLFKDTRIEVKR